MRLSRIFSVVATVLALSRTGFSTPFAGQIQRRQAIILAFDRIAEPTAGSTITGGSSFPFSYVQSDFCHGGYSPYAIWVVAGPDPPTASSLNSTEQFPPGAYEAYLGGWLVSNFFPELPQMAPGPAPSTLVMPVLDPSLVGTTVYIAVVETVDGCPPDGHTEWGLSSVSFTYTS